VNAGLFRTIGSPLLAGLVKVGTSQIAARVYNDMASFFFVLLLALAGAPLAMTMKKPARIFEYPFFMAFAFAAFIVPQALALIRFPGFVEDGSVTAVLIMACFCLISCFLGYQLAPSAVMLNLTSRPIDMNRLFRAGILFIALGYTMINALSTTEAQYSAETGGLTGTATILLFFQLLAYPGFAIALFCALRRPSFTTIAVSIVGVFPLLRDAMVGRRENSTILILTIVMSFFYERHVMPSRLAIAGMLVFSMLAIPATAEYREYANQSNWDAVRQMDLVGGFKRFVSEESTLELRNGAAVIESTRQTGNYQFGKAYWNHIVFRFVPAQLVSMEFKQSLMFDVWDVARASGTETGIQFSRGSTITGMADTFLQFGWLGCLFFAFMGVLFKGMWQASLASNALFARLMYVMTFTSGMRAVTHWTLDFLPGLLYFGIFLGLAGVYAAVPRQRLVGKARPRRVASVGRSQTFANVGRPPISQGSSIRVQP